jgi:hypothetical protein
VCVCLCVVCVVFTQVCRLSHNLYVTSNIPGIRLSDKVFKVCFFECCLR